MSEKLSLFERLHIKAESIRAGFTAGSRTYLREAVSDTASNEIIKALEHSSSQPTFAKEVVQTALEKTARAIEQSPKAMETVEKLTEEVTRHAITGAQASRPITEAIRDTAIRTTRKEIKKDTRSIFAKISESFAYNSNDKSLSSTFKMLAVNAVNATIHTASYGYSAIKTIFSGGNFSEHRKSFLSKASDAITAWNMFPKGNQAPATA